MELGRSLAKNEGSWSSEFVVENLTVQKPCSISILLGTSDQLDSSLHANDNGDTVAIQAHLLLQKLHLL